jgi:hypothetical protein
MSFLKRSLKAISAGFMAVAGLIFIIIGHPWWSWLIGIILIISSIVVVTRLFGSEEMERDDDMDGIRPYN